MKRLLLMMCLACGKPPPMPIEPEPDEPEFTMVCGLAVDMEPDIVERKCGAPFSKMYAPDFPEAVIWKYCRGSCHQMFGVVFYNGKVFRWGRVYEVVQP